MRWGYNLIVKRFLEAWHSLENRLFDALVIGCGVICIVGGLDLPAFNGPIWGAALLVVFGAGLIIATLVVAHRRKSQPR